MIRDTMKTGLRFLDPEEPQVATIEVLRWVVEDGGPLFARVNTVDGYEDVFVPTSVANKMREDALENSEGMVGHQCQVHLVPNFGKHAEHTPWMAVFAVL